MPRGYPRRLILGDEPLVRVVVYLERRSLENLELLVRWRGLGRTRSEIVRDAVRSELARHADHVIRLRRRKDRERREREAEALAPEQRERIAGDALVAEALRVVAQDD